MWVSALAPYHWQYYGDHFISPNASFIANTLFKREREREELYTMPFEYTKSPRGRKVEFGQVSGECSSAEKLLKSN